MEYLNSSDIALYVMYVVIGICGLALFYYFMREDDKAGEMPLELTVIHKILYVPSRLLVLLHRLIGTVLPFADIKPGSEMGVTIKRQLEAAGIYGVEAEDYICMQEIFPVILALGSFLFLGVFTRIPVTVNLYISALFVVIGAYYPYFKVKQRAQLRKEAVFAELPYVVDLLSLAIEAGLDFRKAVERLVEFSEPSPLINELKGFLQELELGTKIEDSLHSMAQRVDILAFFSFVEALIQATRMGVDITPTLHAQAEQMRVTYFQQLEKRANETPILLIFPTILCVFPPMLILLLTPAMATLYYQLTALSFGAN